MAFDGSNGYHGLGFDMEGNWIMESWKEQPDGMVCVHSSFQYRWNSANNLYFILSEEEKINFFTKNFK
jgi:hypothetical protein